MVDNSVGEDTSLACLPLVEGGVELVGAAQQAIEGLRSLNGIDVRKEDMVRQVLSDAWKRDEWDNSFKNKIKRVTNA